MRLRPFSLCLGLALLAPFACNDTATTAPAVVRPQLVAVAPVDFLGSVRCAPPLQGEGGAGGDAGVDSALELDPDAARTYVATLYDVTPAADGSVPNPGTPLASSPPTTCLLQVTFSEVVDHHSYVAEVDAYPQRPEELKPTSPGSRLLLSADGSSVAPRWVATCGGYPASPYVEPGTESAGAAGSAADDARPTGVVSYLDITRTPHDCGAGLVPTDLN